MHHCNKNICANAIKFICYFYKLFVKGIYYGTGPLQCLRDVPQCLKF